MRSHTLLSTSLKNIISIGKSIEVTPFVESINSVSAIESTNESIICSVISNEALISANVSAVLTLIAEEDSSDPPSALLRNRCDE